LVILQDLSDLEKVRRPHSEIYPASSPEGHQAISIKVEKLSDAEDEEDPAPVTMPGISLEPEVSCVSVCVRWISEIWISLILQTVATVNYFFSFLAKNREVHAEFGAGGEKQTSQRPAYPTITVCPHALF
jgi:hypothetical protein